MGIKEILASLNDYLNKGEKKKTAHCDRIDSLLEKLKEKEKGLKKKLDMEKNAGKCKKLKLELKVIGAQRKKGARRRQELRKKCK